MIFHVTQCRTESWRTDNACIYINIFIHNIQALGCPHLKRPPNLSASFLTHLLLVVAGGSAGIVKAAGGWGRCLRHGKQPGFWRRLVSVGHASHDIPAEPRPGSAHVHLRSLQVTDPRSLTEGPFPKSLGSLHWLLNTKCL